MITNNRSGFVDIALFDPYGVLFTISGDSEPYKFFYKNPNPLLQNSPLFINNFPLFIQDFPFFIQNSPFFIQNSPLFIQNSQLFIQNSLLFIQSSPLFIQNSLLFIQSSPLFMQNSLLFIQNSQLFIQNPRYFKLKAISLGFFPSVIYSRLLQSNLPHTTTQNVKPRWPLIGDDRLQELV